MAMSVAQSLAVKLEIVKTSWSALESDLEANSFDIAMEGITITLDRLKVGMLSNPVFSNGKTPITHCGDEPKYGTIAAIDQPGVHVIVSPGGTNECFDRANLQNATIVQWSDNATIFDALVEGEADLIITDAVETRVHAVLRKREARLCLSTERASADLQGIPCSISRTLAMNLAAAGESVLPFL
jgi:cyclohexadienyl dehydratase